MSFTITYKQIDNADFKSGLLKLKDYGFKNSHTSYNVAKIWRKMRTEAETASEVYLKMLRQYAELDEKGRFIETKDPKDPEGKRTIPNTFSVPEEKVETFKKAMEEYQSISFVIPCHQLSLNQLEEARLSGAQLDALDDMITEKEEKKADAA